MMSIKHLVKNTAGRPPSPHLALSRPRSTGDHRGPTGLPALTVPQDGSDCGTCLGLPPALALGDLKSVDGPPNTLVSQFLGLLASNDPLPPPEPSTLSGIPGPETTQSPTTSLAQVAPPPGRMSLLFWPVCSPTRPDSGPPGASTTHLRLSTLSMQRAAPMRPGSRLTPRPSVYPSREEGSRPLPARGNL